MILQAQREQARRGGGLQHHRGGIGRTGVDGDGLDRDREKVNGWVGL